MTFTTATAVPSGQVRSARARTATCDELFASAGFHSVHERAQFRIVLALDAIYAVELIQPDLNFPNERRAAQFSYVITLLNPLRKCEAVNRRKL